MNGHTGEYRWHFQQVHHDIWDYDAPSPVVLFDIEIDGEMRRALAEPSKTGWVYILDRATGEPLLGIDRVADPVKNRMTDAHGLYRERPDIEALPRLNRRERNGLYQARLPHGLRHHGSGPLQNDLQALCGPPRCFDLLRASA